MRVLGEEAAKDPAAVEARVNCEIAERKTNARRRKMRSAKLTKEQRQEKLTQQQEGNAAKGIFVTI